jgi:hypothetical protein
MTKLTKAPAGPMLADATEVIWHKTIMHMYGVSESQLEELTAGYNSLHLVCFGISVGAALTLFIAFRQAASTAPERPYYFGSMIAMCGLSILFGGNGIMNYLKASRRKSRLYRESVPIDK